MKIIWTGIPSDAGNLMVPIPKKLHGEKIEILIRKYSKVKLKHAGQYAYLFGYIYSTIADQSGYAKYDVTPEARKRAILRCHNGMKIKFNPEEIELFNYETKTKETRIVGGSTTKLSHKGLVHFTELITAFWSTEWGIEFLENRDEWITGHEDQIITKYNGGE